MKGFESVIAAAVALLVTFLIEKPLISYLKKLHCRQEIREEGPKWHQAKSGTPTMGGIAMIIGYFVAIGIALTVGIATDSETGKEAADPFFLTVFLSGALLSLGMGAVGFIDDYIKVVKKRNLGLTAIQKTGLEMLVTASFLASLALGGMQTTYLPFVGDVSIVSGWGLIFWPIALFFVYGFVNAVNLTDGVDGLASGVTLVASCGLMLLSVRLGHSLNNVSACAVAGATAGFLMWNAHPAKVFMGDTGSLFLGGAVTALAFGTGKPILLLAFGFIYLCEALSVCLQVACFKLTGKRLFKMSPIHHHFELCGWNEDKIVMVFSLVTLLMSAAVCLPYYW